MTSAFKLMRNSFKTCFLILCLLTTGVLFGQNNPAPNEAAVVTDEAVRFTVLTPQVIRMEWQAQEQFNDQASFVFINRDLPAPEFKVNRTKKWLTIKTDHLTLRYRRGSGQFDAENLSIKLKLNEKEITWQPGLQDDQNLLGTARTLDGATGGKQWNGEPVELEHGIISRSGWALINDTNNFLLDDSEWSWVQKRDHGAHQDLYFFGHGHDYKQALKDFVSMAGKIPVPPKYALGYWWSRYWVYSDPELRNLMKEMRSYGIPIDVLVIDMDWHETFGGLKNIHDPQIDETGHKLGWTGYSWNKNLFPQPEKFLQWTENFHLKTALNLHPASGIAPMEDQYKDFAKAIDFDASSNRYIRYQMADKKWAQAYFDVVLQPMEKQGVDFWWLDWQQEPESALVKGLSHTWWINHTFFTDMERRGSKRPLLFHRWGGLGNHRYQIGFSGDDKIHWESLRYQTYFTHTAANVGYGYWSHDIGGHSASEWSQNEELYLRWLQFGIFSPILRTHSAKMSSVERRFWMYPDLFPKMRELINLRYALVPYLYNAAREAHDEGLSILRPMYYEHPEKEDAYQQKYQYYFGNDMIVAPIADSISSANQLAERELWLPEGQWYEWFTGTMLEGDQVMRRKYALHEVPVFVKAGSIVPMYPKISHLQQEIDTLILKVFPGGNDELAYYEDDGESVDYQQKDFTITPIKSERSPSGMKLNIAPTEGQYKGMNDSRSYEVHVVHALPPKSVMVNGQAYSYSEESKPGHWTYDAQNLEIKVILPTLSRSEAISVEVALDETTPQLLDGKKGQFARLSYAIGKMKVEVARDSWWATMPNSVLKAEQTPVMISYSPGQAQRLLRDFDNDYANMLNELGSHVNARKPVAAMWVKYLSNQ